MLIRECFQMFCLATADYRRERLLSLCSILGLAAVLAPLLVLYGVKFGVVTTMVSRMRSDPLTLELSPVSSGHFTGDFFTSLRQEPGVAFVLPRTRSIAATMQLSNTAGDGTRRTVVCSMEPTAAGDPLLARYGCEAPVMALQEGKQTSPDSGTKHAPDGETRSSLMERLGAVLLPEAHAQPAEEAQKIPAAQKKPEAAKHAPLRNAGVQKHETPAGTKAGSTRVNPAVPDGRNHSAGQNRAKAAPEDAPLPAVSPLALPLENQKPAAGPDSQASAREKAGAAEDTQAPAPENANREAADTKPGVQARAAQKEAPAQETPGPALHAGGKPAADADTPAPGAKQASHGLMPRGAAGKEPSPLTGGLGENDATLRLSGVVLSEEAAARLHVKKGDTVIGRVERANRGKISAARVKLVVTGVLPLAAQQKAMAYIPLPLLEATEDFRDGRAVPELGTENGWTGEPRPEGERVYPGFRLYVKDLGDVLTLRARLAAKGVDTYTHAEEIAQIESLEKALNAVFLAICAAAALGFFASTASSAMASVKRKERTLGLLELTGFSTGSLMLFPLVQVEFTAFFGTILASGAYLGFSWLINHLFASSLQGLESVCLLLPRHFGMALACAMGLSFLAAFGPALKSTRIQPSEVIRDV